MLTALLVGLSSLLPAERSWSAPPPSVSSLYEDALMRFEKTDYPGAVVQLKNALQKDRSHLPSQLLLGRVLLANGDVLAAEVALNEALRLGVDRGEVVLPLARALINQGKQQELLNDVRLSPTGLRPDAQIPILLIMAGAAADLGDRSSALRSLADAKALGPGRIDPYLAEVPIRLRFGQNSEAMAAADKALAIQPNSAEAKYLKGTIFQGKGNVLAARPLYDATIEASPRHLEALISRAGIFLDLNNISGLEQDIGAISSIAPKDPRGLFLKAMLSDRKGRKSTAQEAFKAAVDILDPAPAQFLRFRPQLLMIGALSHHSLGNVEKTKQYLEVMLAQQPGNPAAKLLAQIAMKEKNYTRAVEVLETYLRSNNNDVQALSMLSSVNMALGRHVRAAQQTSDALRISDSTELRTLLGASLIGSGQISDAERELSAVVKRDPGNVAASAALVLLNMGAGNSTKAAQLADALRKRHPRNVSVAHLLGLAKAEIGDSAAARRAFEGALALQANHVPALVGLAKLDMQAGDDLQASKRLDQALKFDPQNVLVNITLGLMSERRGQLAEAQRFIEKADDLAGPANYSAALTLAEFHLRHGQTEAAKKAVQRATARSTDAVPVLLTTARVDIAAGDRASAKTTLTRASSSAGQDPAAHVRIALLQLQVDRPEAVAYSVEKALASHPRWLPARALMADIELRQGALDKAEARAKAIVAEFPKLGVGHALLGDVAARREQPAQAIAHYRRAHDLERNSASAARVYQLMSGLDGAAAETFARDWLKVMPNDVGLRRQMAARAARAGRWDDARLLYEAILVQTPQDADALNDLANVLVELGSPAALAIAEKALTLKPTTAYVLGTAGWAALKSGQTDRALQLLRDARLRDPTNADTRYFLSAALNKSGRTAEAKLEIEAALQAGRPLMHEAAAKELARTLR